MLKDYLFELFQAAVAAAHPSRVLPPLLREVRGPVTVVGAGKAAAGMALAVEAAVGNVQGAVVVPRGQAAAHGCTRIKVMEAPHPLPDESSAMAAVRMLELAAAAGRTPDGTLLCLLSGGGSSLMSLPPPGVTVAEKAALVHRLLASGVPIQQVNCVRRHLSLVKGGRLAISASPAAVITLAISDVVGDSPADIASGPTVGDPTTAADALSVLRTFRIDAPASVLAALAGPDAETPFPDDPRLDRCVYRIAASGEDALRAAAGLVRDREVINLGAGVTGDSGAAAAEHARIVREAWLAGRRCAILSGGETTTVIRGPGRGGSNTEFLLSLAIELEGLPRVWAFAADTDGMDGRGGHAGAWFGPGFTESLVSMRQAAISSLDASDSAGFFDAAGLLVVTGPTGTNVNDFRVILVD